MGESRRRSVASKHAFNALPWLLLPSVRRPIAQSVLIRFVDTQLSGANAPSQLVGTAQQRDCLSRYGELRTASIANHL